MEYAKNLCLSGESAFEPCNVRAIVGLVAHDANNIETRIQLRVFRVSLQKKLRGLNHFFLLAIGDSFAWMAEGALGTIFNLYKNDRFIMCHD